MCLIAIYKTLFKSSFKFLVKVMHYAYYKLVLYNIGDIWHHFDDIKIYIIYGVLLTSLICKIGT